MTPPDAPDSDDTDGFDPEDRALCPDGSCTGLLGPDGRCRLCGRAEGTLDAPVPAVELQPPPASLAGHEPEAADEAGFASRELCPDGACIGVIGPDGRCSECGHRARPS